MDLVLENHLLNSEEVRRGQSILASYPLQVNIELTGVCNINPPCLFCSGKNFGHNYAPLDPKYLEKYLTFLERCDHINEDSFGEPLSHPGLIPLAQRVTANGQVFSFVTNGLLLTKARAERLAICGPNLGMHVSFNAATAQTFYQLTGKKFSLLVENVRFFVEEYRRQHADAELHLILTFIVMKINRDEVTAFLHLCKELGGRPLLASLHNRPSIPLGDFGYDFVYEDEMLPYQDLCMIGAHAKQVAAELGIPCLIQWDAGSDSAIQGFSESQVDIPCLVPWRFLFIQEHTQKVFACPYHRHPYGDLTTASLDEIWNGEVAQEIRTSLAQGELPKYCLDHSAGCPLVMKAYDHGLSGPIESSIVIGTNDLAHCIEGWHALEYVPEAIRWTRQQSRFRIQINHHRKLTIEAIVWGEHTAKTPVSGHVEIAGQRIGSFCLRDTGWAVLNYALPAHLIALEAEGAILIDTPWTPKRVGLGNDTRELGIAVRRIFVS